MNKLQRVLNAAAYVFTGARKFDSGLGQILHDKLYWLDVPDRLFFNLVVTVHQCLNGHTPLYLLNYCVPVASPDTRRHLHSTNRQLLADPTTGSTLMAIGFLLPALQSRTVFRFSSGTQRSVQTVSDSYLKCICLLDISAFQGIRRSWWQLR